MLYCLLKSLLLEEITEGISYCQNRFVFLTYTMRTDPWAFFSKLYCLLQPLLLQGSLRACDLWMTLQRGPNSQSLTTAVLGMHVDPFRPQSWQPCVVENILMEGEVTEPHEGFYTGLSTLLLLKTCVSTYFHKLKQIQRFSISLHKSKMQKQHPLFCILLQRQNRGIELLGTLPLASQQ